MKTLNPPASRCRTNRSGQVKQLKTASESGEEKDGFSGNPEPCDCLSRWGGECEGLSVEVLRRVLCLEAGEAGRIGLRVCNLFM